MSQGGTSITDSAERRRANLRIGVAASCVILSLAGFAYGVLHPDTLAFGPKTNLGSISVLCAVVTFLWFLVEVARSPARPYPTPDRSALEPPEED